MEVILKSGEFGYTLKITEALQPKFKMSQFKEVIEKEMGIPQASQLIIDEKGIDLSTMHADEVLPAPENKKMPSTYYVFNDSLKSESDVKKIYELKYPQALDERNLNNITISNGLIDIDIEERYNFKPIYAAQSYVNGLDLITLQNFEQTFFNDYTMLKKAYRKYKHTKGQCYNLMKDIDVQSFSQEYVRKAIYRTVDFLNNQRSSIKKKFMDNYEVNNQIVKQHVDSMNDLKKYPVHPVLRSEKKQFLMDFYYDEAQINKWKDSCIRTQEGYKLKFEKFDKDMQTVRQKYSINPQDSERGNILDESKQRIIMKKLQSISSEKEPLILSIVSTVYDDLKEFHKQMNVFCAANPSAESIRQSQSFFSNIDNLKKQIKAHQELADEMEEHTRELQIIYEEIRACQLRNAIAIMNEMSVKGENRKEIKQFNVTHEYIKYLNDTVVRIEKDFTYLQQPGMLPRAYEKALIEIQKRRKFRKILDDGYNKLKEMIQKERESRQLFHTEYGKYFPNDFISQLKDPGPSLRLEGGNKDYELPQIEDNQIDDYDEYQFNSGGSSKVDKTVDPELQKKYQDLLKESSLIKEEHKSNIKELNNKIQELDSTLKQNKDRIADLNKQLNIKDQDIAKFKIEVEKLAKNLKDSAMAFNMQQRSSEDTIQRKTKEVESLMREKKCKNCVLCLEDLKDKAPDAALINDLNDRLLAKTKRIDSLEDQLRKQTGLVHQVCSSNFAFLRTKTQDFYKNLDQVKQSYEQRLMEVEERLSLEQKRCETLIKTRVAVLEDKYQKSKQRELELAKKVKEMQIHREQSEKEIKIYSAKQRDLLQEISKLNSDCQKFLQEKKSLDDEIRKMRALVDDEKAKSSSLQQKSERTEDQISKLQFQLNQIKSEKGEEVKKLQDKAQNQAKALQEVQEEKIKLEEKVKKENSLLIKQLNELKEQNEKDMREKNENILRLNNIINQHLEQNQHNNAIETRLLKEQIEKYEKEMSIKIKDLQEVTLILSKRDKEIQQLKKDIDKLNQEIQSLQSDKVSLEVKIQSSKKDQENQQNNEIEKMKEYLKNVESEYKQKTLKSKENESVLQRIKEFTCTALNLTQDSWESGLTRAITACTFENINFMRALEGCRVLFMPHSPGVYLALVLKSVEDIDMDLQMSIKNQLMNISDSISLSKSEATDKPVRKLIIKNNLFLDVESLSKNLQTILNNFQMIVIARLKGVTKHIATADNNPFDLEEKEPYFLCQIEKLEHFVGFEGEDFSFTDYACK